ncbi:MAG: hypothetical protein EBR82_04495 [Caulobacteraceae bacterium]|nr:hypothetical protein [Caulobacteraceae bacterium]
MKAEYQERLKNSDLSQMPPWLFVTSAELAKAIGVHIQTLSNWRLRGNGPPAAPSAFFKGRPTRYMVAHVHVWAAEQAGTSIEPWKLNAAWLRDNMQFSKAEDREAVQARVQLLMRLSRDFRPENLTFKGRSGLIG